MERTVNTFTSSKWIQERNLAENDMVRAVFVLKKDQHAVREFDAKLMDISNPKSANYGKWLKPEEVKERLAPSSDKVKTVTDFLQAHGKFDLFFSSLFVSSFCPSLSENDSEK